MTPITAVKDAQTEVNLDIDSIQSDLGRVVASESFVRGDQKSRHNMLANFVNRYEGVDLAYMVDGSGIQCVPNANGKAIQVAYDGDGTGVDRSDRAWYAIPAKTGKPYVSRKYLSVATGQLCMTVALPVVDQSVNLVGVVAVDLPIKGH